MFERELSLITKHEEAIAPEKDQVKSLDEANKQIVFLKQELAHRMKNVT